MNTFDKIYAQVRRIPRGKVATYGQIATLAGNPHWSQVVGYALHGNPSPETIPCHRVVKVTRAIRTCLRAGYFDAFHPICSRKAPALLRPT